MSKLHDAAASGDTETCKRLLDAGADVDARAADGQTPLHVAAYYSRIETAALLLEHGATEEVPK